MGAFYIYNAATGEKMMIGGDNNVDLLFVEDDDHASVELDASAHPDNDGVVVYHGQFKLLTDTDPMSLWLITPTDDVIRLTQKPEIIPN